MTIIAKSKGVSLYELSGGWLYLVTWNNKRKVFNTYSFAVDYFLSMTK